MATAGKRVWSPFLQPGCVTEADQLALLHLKRDHLIPTILRSEDADDEGYQEGKVINTRFGSFPHSTLLRVPWGSQIRASRVDTGSRGRRSHERSDQISKKRKRESDENANVLRHQGPDDTKMDSPGQDVKVPIEASSGFVHLLPPTPESWTASLPHRTQVVYTPDYSYILHRIRARPGTRLIEAGAGSGSFTHAAARAVFNEDLVRGTAGVACHRRKGKVWSFEFHEQRFTKLKKEISDHRLDQMVQLTLRDVCHEGFHPVTSNLAEVKASAVFLDLPAPWLALKHLNHGADSPLDPTMTTHLCTFSPCIEQVQRTVSALRQLGWLEIEACEIAAKRIETRRERVGIHEEGLRGVNDSPANVEEALKRLREVESHSRAFLNGSKDDPRQDAPFQQQESKQERLKAIRDAQEGRKLYNEGQLTTRNEPELKTHTSYLVFAVLPRQWTAEDESVAQMKESIKNADPSATGQGVERQAKTEGQGRTTITGF